MGGFAFNVRDFGAVGDGVADDRPSIEAAITACNAAGGGTVYMPAGTYRVTGTGRSSDGAIEILDNVTLKGDSMGQTIVKLADGQNSMSGIVRTPVGVETRDAALMDLTIDGNRANQAVQQNGFFCGVSPGSPLYDENITVKGVEIKDCSGYGFDPHEVTRNLLLENCVAHGNALEGFTIDYCVDSKIINCVAYNNDVHGFMIVTNSSNVLIENCIAYGNGSSGLQTGSDAHDITIIGGAYYENRTGISLRDGARITIEGAEIYGNERFGIAVGGIPDVVIRNNDIHDNSVAGDGKYSQIALLDWTDKVSGETFATTGAIVESNTLYATGSIRASYGIEEKIGNSNGNSFWNNTISGYSKGATFFKPDVTMPIDDVTAVANAPLTLTLSAQTFTDQDDGDALALVATRADSSPLPPWLVFDAATGTFSGTPLASDVGSIEVTVTAADTRKATAMDTFVLTVASALPNSPPTATDDHWTVSAGTNVKLASAVLLANDTDPDGQELEVTGVGDSVGGGSVSLGSDGVIGFMSPDVDAASFGYTVTDGEAMATGTVSVSVVATTAGTDVIELATPAGASSYIDGFAGADILYGGDGFDVLRGGDDGDWINGGDGADILYGGDGNDWIDGGGGADLLYGSEGDDTFVIENTGDRVVEWFKDGVGGFDTVFSGIGGAMPQNVETLVLTGLAADAVGTKKADIMIGNGQQNILDGGAGDDTLAGGEGNDVMIGGAGADVTSGGTGNDIIRFLQVSDSTPTLSDIVTDFQPGDVIDLAAVFSGTLSFLHTTAFTQVAGQLRVEASDAGVVARADTDGDGLGDFQVLLADVPLASIDSAGFDFIL